MEEKLVNILNQMAEYLNISQMKKLQEVLLKNLAQPETTKVETTNDTYLQMFLDAKKIEGCSERTLQYYRVTVEKMFQMLRRRSERSQRRRSGRIFRNIRRSTTVGNPRSITFGGTFQAFSRGWKKRIMS